MLCRLAVAALLLLPATAAAQDYVPQRVYDTRRIAFSDFETMAAEASRADAVFIGEQHDDPNTHRLEYAVLAALLRRGVAPILSLEMFERDVQPLLDRYLAGTLSEKELVEQGRPWPRYATDYRPLVELAKAHGWPVLAANAPRRLVAEIARSGREALASFAPADRAWLARDIECPLDGYFERFIRAMSAHDGAARQPGGEAGASSQAMERYFWAQCSRDETMAETVARAVESPARKGPVVHVTGAFHSDFGAGTAERTRRRLPGRRLLIVSILPVADLDGLSPSGEDLRRADFLVYTIAARRPHAPAPRDTK